MIKIIGFDIANGKDESVHMLFSRGRAMRICKNFDNDCNDVESKTTCWLFDVTTGVCPFLNKETDYPNRGETP